MTVKQIEAEDRRYIDMSAEPQFVPAEQVFPRSKYLPLKPNNYQLDPSISTCHPVIMDILQGHPLWPAFNETASVPEVYLQQFWGTLQLNTNQTPNRLQAQIANTTVSFSCSCLRKILKLPTADSIPGKKKFDARFSESRVCQDICSLGYLETFTKVPEFKRLNLAQPWSTLFMIVNKCLSGKHTGLDRCSTRFMDVFHGIAFNYHFNYAAIFWNELMDLVARKNSKKRTFLPHWRFLSIIVHYFLEKFLDIPMRPNSELKTPKVMSFLQKDSEILDIQAMVIPESLLCIANQDAPAVKAYRKLHNLPTMGQPQPIDPAEGGSPVRSEGLEIEGVQGGVGVSETDGEQGSASADDDVFEGHDGVRKERHTKSLFDLASKKAKAVNQAVQKSAKEKEHEKERPKRKKSKAKRPKSSTKSTNSVDTEEAMNEIDMAFETIISERNEGVYPTTDISLAGSISTGTDSFRTHVAMHAHLLDDAGTFVDVSPSGQPRGSKENHFTVNVLPAVNTNHVTEHVSTTVQMGSLINPGVTASNLVTPEFQRSSQDQLLMEVVATVLSSMTDKGKATIPETPLRQINLPPPPVSHSTSQIIDELKSSLMVQLLKENPSRDDKDLLDLLRDHSRKSSSPGLSDNQFIDLNAKMDAQHKEVLAQIVDINKNYSFLNDTLQKLSKEVRSLKETCSALAIGLKRKHDDTNDLDHHEGEKRQRAFKPLLSAPIGANSETMQPETTS